MRRILFGITVGLLACTVAGTLARSEPLEGVNVEASRVVKETIGRAPNSAPIQAISLSYRVSYADLDLATADGAAKLDKRVQDAAMAACKEISRMYPLATPDDTACARKATADAMGKVKEAVAAAGKAPKK
ncbi:MAG: UrcA family protein [Gammaproteobacteria bacterium]|nr:UrcA family protein [Gammaproteobacteria bacterium]